MLSSRQCSHSCVRCADAARYGASRQRVWDWGRRQCHCHLKQNSPPSPARRRIAHNFEPRAVRAGYRHLPQAFAEYYDTRHFASNVSKLANSPPRPLLQLLKFNAQQRREGVYCFALKRRSSCLPAAGIRFLMLHGHSRARPLRCPTQRPWAPTLELSRVLPTLLRRAALARILREGDEIPDSVDIEAMQIFGTDLLERVP